MRLGNTIARGYGLGKVKITVDSKSARWMYTNDLTSAHNDFPYMQDAWHTFDEGKIALKEYMKKHLSPAIGQLIKDLHSG